MPIQSFVLLIGGVILAAGVTVAVVFGLVPLAGAPWVLPLAIVAALTARYLIPRSKS